MAKYFNELRNLLKHCSFYNKLDDYIRDILVSGINNLQIHKQLLTEGSELSLDNATKVALSTEAAIKQVLELGAGVKINFSGKNSSWAINEVSVKRAPWMSGCRCCGS